MQQKVRSDRLVVNRFPFLFVTERNNARTRFSIFINHWQINLLQCKEHVRHWFQVFLLGLLQHHLPCIWISENHHLNLHGSFECRVPSGSVFLFGGYSGMMDYHYMDSIHYGFYFAALRKKSMYIIGFVFIP